MLLQTLMTVAILVLLAASLLTSTLVTAKAALHRTVTRQISVSLARGTDDLTRWAAQYVYANHADAVWPSKAQDAAPVPVCASADSTPCGLIETTSYEVTGSSALPLAKDAAAATIATAQNLQTAVGEQRISAEVTATLTDASGATLGSGTRELTLRIFDAPPWAIVTGSRDLTSVLGATNASEGDTAGYQRSIINAPLDTQTPNPADPSSFRDTVIGVTMTCTNSAANSDEANGSRDDHAPGNESLPWGVSGAAFETPCMPTFSFDSAHQAPADLEPVSSGNYDVGVFASPKGWESTDTASGSSWTL